MNYNQIMHELLDSELYRHCLQTAETAVCLAKHYDQDADKAYLTGLVHDYGKRYSKQELNLKADQMGLTLDRITRQQEKLLHAPVGAALLKRELKITDPVVLGAVKYHTTGGIGMSLFEKIIYLADKIEAGRQYPGVEKIRKLAYVKLDQALLVVVDNAISSVLSRGLLLHPRSVAFRNFLLAEGVKKADS